MPPMTQSQLDDGRGADRVAQAPTVLALETSTTACSVALTVRGIVYAEHRVEPRGHNRLLLPMVDALLSAAGVGREALDAVAFGRGPGSFTGVRIAAGVAQGISLGLSIPVVPVSSLAALAWETIALHADAEGVLATIRSRPNETYVAAYRVVAGGWETVAAEAVAVAANRDVPACVDATWCAAGDGAEHFAAQLVLLGCRVDAALLPSARGVLALALSALSRGETVAAAQALPVYLQGTQPWRKLAD
jgi:tRNA threonylcarbamoyladenosine biosynthesis protein TsaB